ncbi:MAG: glucodextranase DOMON-like domain-containing protein [Halanaerobiales bacterium]
MKKTTIFIVFLLFIFIMSYTAEAGEDNLFFSINDAEGDDYGPGSYLYPENEVFNDNQLFDITKFEIEQSSINYKFIFTFKKLPDPWQSQFGFSLPLIQLYIDNRKGGATRVFDDGANVRFDSRHPWDLLLDISGWWIRLYRPEDKYKSEDALEMKKNPYDLEEALVEVEDNKIYVTVSKDEIGNLIDAYIYIVVGSFDPFGPDNYRVIESEKSNWNFFDPGIKTAAPRVIDIILPSSRKQTEVLSNYNDDYAVIYPVRIASASESNITLLIAIIFVITICMILLFYIVYKKLFLTNNNK